MDHLQLTIEEHIVQSDIDNLEGQNRQFNVEPAVPHISRELDQHKDQRVQVVEPFRVVQRDRITKNYWNEALVDPISE